MIGKLVVEYLQCEVRINHIGYFWSVIPKISGFFRVALQKYPIFFLILTGECVSKMVTNGHKKSRILPASIFEGSFLDSFVATASFDLAATALISAKVKISRFVFCRQKYCIQAYQVLS
jgi:hypothetical protein